MVSYHEPMQARQWIAVKVEYNHMQAWTEKTVFCANERKLSRHLQWPSERIISPGMWTHFHLSHADAFFFFVPPAALVKLNCSRVSCALPVYPHSYLRYHTSLPLSRLAAPTSIHRSISYEKRISKGWWEMLWLPSCFTCGGPVVLPWLPGLRLTQTQQQREYEAVCRGMWQRQLTCRGNRAIRLGWTQLSAALCTHCDQWECPELKTL